MRLLVLCRRSLAPIGKQLKQDPVDGEIRKKRQRHTLSSVGFVLTSRIPSAANTERSEKKRAGYAVLIRFNAERVNWSSRQEEVNGAILVCSATSSQ